MIDIKISLSKDTPLEVVLATASYLVDTSKTLHGIDTNSKRLAESMLADNDNQGDLRVAEDAVEKIAAERAAKENVVPFGAGSVEETVAEENKAAVTPANQMIAEASKAPNSMYDENGVIKSQFKKAAETVVGAEMSNGEAAAVAEQLAAPSPILADAVTTEVDAKGMPWDKRIHAATKTKVKDGTWKKKRGVSDVTLRQVEAEIKFGSGDMTQDVVPAAPVAPVVPQNVVPAAPIPAPVQPQNAVPTAPAVPQNVIPMAPVAPAAAPIATAQPRSYSELAGLVGRAINEDLLHGAEIERIVQSYGYPGVPMLQQAEPEAIGAVYNSLATAMGV